MRALLFMFFAFSYFLAAAQADKEDFYHWLYESDAKVPIVHMDIVDSLLPADKLTYLDAVISIEGNGVIPSIQNVPVLIKGRGNSSWKKNPHSKNPYRLKFPKKQNLMGERKGKNWVLLANSRRGSMLTNAIGLYIAHLLKIPFANHVVPVELYMNGNYWGSYNLTEKVGVSNNSINLRDESRAALLEIDSYFDAEYKFVSQPYQLPVNIKYPDFQTDSTSISADDVEADFTLFLSQLVLHNDISGIVDNETLAKFFLLQELTDNTEMWKPRSMYVFKAAVGDDSSKYQFAPVWDFDWAFGVNKNGQRFFEGSPHHDFWDRSFSLTNEFWIDLRFLNPGFQDIYYKVWAEFMDSGLSQLLDFCEKYYAFAEPSIRHNSQIRNDSTDYQAQVLQAVAWLDKRAHDIYGKLSRPGSYWTAFTRTDSVNVYSIQGVRMLRNIPYRELRHYLQRGFYVIDGKVKYIY